MPEIRYCTTIDACSCPDWHFRGARDQSPCKHMRRLREALEIVQAQAEFNRSHQKETAHAQR